MRQRGFRYNACPQCAQDTHLHFAVSLDADGPTCPGETVSFTCSSLPAADNFIWFYNKVRLGEFLSGSDTQQDILLETESLEFTISSPSPTVSVLTFGAPLSLFDVPLRCGSSISTPDSNGASKVLNLNTVNTGELVHESLG